MSSINESSLFVKPSEVIERLRAVRDMLSAGIEDFPEFDVIGGGDMDLIVKNGLSTLPFCLYVMTEGGTSSQITEATYSPNSIVSGISVVLVMRTEDSRVQFSDEMGVWFKNFIVRALLSWDINEISGGEPLVLTGDSVYEVQGHAVYVHSYSFSQTVIVRADEFDDIYGLWDDLDWFRRSLSDVHYIAANGSDAHLEIATEVDPEA